MPLGGINVQCIVVTRRIQRTLMALLSNSLCPARSLSFRMCFHSYLPCAFSHSHSRIHKQTRTKRFLTVLPQFLFQLHVSYFIHSPHARSNNLAASFLQYNVRKPIPLFVSLLHRSPSPESVSLWRQCCILTSRVVQSGKEWEHAIKLIKVKKYASEVDLQGCRSKRED